MSIVGIFTQSRPQIGGLVFDAVLRESSELITEVTEFPVETGAIGNDHAVQRPLMLTMRVGVSDNAFRSLAAQAADVVTGVDDSLLPLTRAITGTAVGAALGTLSGSSAAVAGLGGSVLNAAYAAGQATTRSQSVLDAIRDIQRANAIVNIVASKREYHNCMITNTRQETNKENEGGLELVVELQQLILITHSPSKAAIPAPDDPAETQAQELRDFGRLSLQ